MLINAASRLLVEEGPDSLTVRRIAQELECSTKIIYTMFHGKEGLANALYLGDEGALINIASTASFQPLPYMAVYGASKAFVLSFSQALSAEYRGRGLRVLVLCPGATETGFFGVAGEAASVGARRTPEQVAATGLLALERGRSVVVDGRTNALIARVSRLLPGWLVSRIAGQSVRPQQKLATCGKGGTRML